MQRSVWHLLTLCFSFMYLYSCASDDLPSKTQDELNSITILKPCSEQWFIYVEDYIPTGDGAGHGTDLGSAEWMSVIEFKLGLRDNSDVPKLGSEDWCEYIDAKVTSEHN